MVAFRASMEKQLNETGAQIANLNLTWVHQAGLRRRATTQPRIVLRAETTTFSAMFAFDLIVDLVASGLVDPTSATQSDTLAQNASSEFFSDLSASLVSVTSSASSPFVQDFVEFANEAATASGGGPLDLSSLEPGDNTFSDLAASATVEIEQWQRPSQHQNPTVSPPTEFEDDNTIEGDDDSGFSPVETIGAAAGGTIVLLVIAFHVARKIMKSSGRKPNEVVPTI